jgi:hypothetical protein
MNVVMNGYMIAWLYGPRNGTPGKVHQLKIQNLKERCTTAYIKIQDPMNLPPQSPRSSKTHYSNIPSFQSILSAAN